MRTMAVASKLILCGLGPLGRGGNRNTAFHRGMYFRGQSEEIQVKCADGLREGR